MMNLIDLIKKHKSAKVFEADFQEAKKTCNEATFYQPDADGNTAFHHMVFAMDAGLAERDAILMLYYLVGIDEAVLDKRLDINAKNNDQVSAVDLAFDKGYKNFSKAMSLMNCVSVDSNLADVFFSAPYAVIKKQITSPNAFFQPAAASQVLSQNVSSEQRPPNLMP